MKGHPRLPLPAVVRSKVSCFLNTISNTTDFFFFLNSCGTSGPGRSRAPRRWLRKIGLILQTHCLQLDVILEEIERAYGLAVALAHCVGKKVIWKESPSWSAMVAVSLQLTKRILCVLHTGTVPEDKLLGELFCHRQLRGLFCCSSYCLPKQTPWLETTVNFRSGMFSMESWQYLEVFLGIAVEWLVPPCKGSYCDFTNAPIFLWHLPLPFSCFPLGCMSPCSSIPSAQKLLACWRVYSSCHSLSNASGLF